MIQRIGIGHNGNIVAEIRVIDRALRVFLTDGIPQRVAGVKPFLNHRLPDAGPDFHVFGKAELSVKLCHGRITFLPF